MKSKIYKKTRFINNFKFYNVIFVTIIVKCFAFVRDVLLARNIGVSAQSDALFLVFALFSIVTAVYIDLINSSTFGVLKEIELKKGNPNRFILTLLMSSILIFTSFSVANYFFPKIILWPFLKNLDSRTQIFSLDFSRILLFSVIFFTISHLLKTILKYDEKFIQNLLIEMIRNLIVAVYLLLVSSFSVRNYIYVLLLSYVLESATLLFIYIKKIVYRKEKLSFAFDFINLKVFITASLPILVMSIMYQLNSYIDKFFASTLEIGNITYMNNSFRIFGIFLSLFIFSINMISFSKMAKIFERNYIIDYVTRAIKRNIIISSIIFGFILLSSEELVRIIFYSGNFSEYDIQVMALCLKIYSLALVAYSVRDILTKYFYQMLRNRVPMVIGIVGVVTNIVLNIILITYYDVYGLIIATSIATFLSTIIAIMYVKKELNISGILFLFLKTTISVLVVVFIVSWAKGFLNFPLLLNAVIVGVIYSVLIVISMFLVIGKKKLFEILDFS